MNLDDYWPTDAAPALECAPRKCGHPRDRRVQREDGSIACSRCNAVLDTARLRRGKRSDRLGKDNERRIQRVYGPTKIGQRGDAVDHIGRIWRWQSKASRNPPAGWLALIDRPTERTPPNSVLVALAKMELGDLYGPRRSVVIRSFVRAGGRAEGRTRDWLFVHADDASAELGLTPARYPGWWVIPGDWWLDHFGRDE